jgi:hypothetical protein
MPIHDLLSQLAVSLVVVTLYHLWASRKKQSAPVPAAPATTPPAALAAPIMTPPKALPATEQIPPEIIAVIAAAIAVVLGRPHRLVSVEQAAAQTPEVNVWAMEGRIEQFMSHRVR